MPGNKKPGSMQSKLAIPQYITDLPWYLSDEKVIPVSNNNDGNNNDAPIQDPTVKGVYDFSHHYLETDLSKRATGQNTTSSETVNENPYEIAKDDDKSAIQLQHSNFVLYKQFQREMQKSAKRDAEKEDRNFRRYYEILNNPEYNFNRELEESGALLSMSDEISDSELALTDIPTKFDDVNSWGQNLAGREEIPVYMVTNKSVYDTLDDINGIDSAKKDIIAALDNTISGGNSHLVNMATTKNSYVWKQFDKRSLLKDLPTIHKVYDPKTHTFNSTTNEVALDMIEYAVADSRDLANELAILSGQSKMKNDEHQQTPTSTINKVENEVFENVANTVKRKATFEKEKTQEISNEINNEANMIFEKELDKRVDLCMHKPKHITTSPAKRRQIVKTAQKNAKKKDQDILNMY